MVFSRLFYNNLLDSEQNNNIFLIANLSRISRPVFSNTNPLLSFPLPSINYLSNGGSVLRYGTHAGKTKKKMFGQRTLLSPIRKAEKKKKKQNCLLTSRSYLVV